MGDNKPKNFMQLAGRILLAFMFITLIRFELSFFQIIQDIVGSILMVMVTGRARYLISESTNLNRFLAFFSRLQDETLSAHPRRSLDCSESLPQRMVDHSIVQAAA
jgi:hypothetical protein